MYKWNVNNFGNYHSVHKMIKFLFLNIYILSNIIPQNLCQQPWLNQFFSIANFLLGEADYLLSFISRRSLYFLNWIWAC